MDKNTNNPGMGRWGLAFAIGIVMLFAGFASNIGVVLAAGVLIILGAFGAALFAR
jgi:hypothetical protein